MSQFHFSDTIVVFSEDYAISFTVNCLGLPWVNRLMGVECLPPKFLRQLDWSDSFSFWRGILILLFLSNHLPRDLNYGQEFIEFEEMAINILGVKCCPNTLFLDKLPIFLLSSGSGVETQCMFISWGEGRSQLYFPCVVQHFLINALPCLSCHLSCPLSCVDS